MTVSLIPTHTPRTLHLEHISDMTIDQVKAQFDAYLKAFNTHNVDNFSPFLAEDFHFHVPALPPANSKEEVLNQFTNVFFPAFREEIHPTFLSFGERSVAMEAIVKCEAKIDLDQPLPFTGLTYRKGEKFEYPIVLEAP